MVKCSVRQPLFGAAAKPRICSELFGLFTASHFRVGSFAAPIGGQKTFTFEMGLTEAQTWDVDNLGVRIFLFHESGLATMRSLLETALLFTPLHTKGVAPLAAKRNVDFLKKYMVNILQEGQLYVAESTVNSSYWPTNGIQRTPFREWIAQARAASYSVVHAPLKQQYRESFDERGANAFFHQYKGLEYGYHALFTGWIDTLHDNYPCMPPFDRPEKDRPCLVWEIFEVGVPIVTRYIPRLEKPLASIPAVPEPDGVLYPSSFNNGTDAPSISMVCDVFVCAIWKAAGLFKEIDNDFSCTEQTNVDTCLKLFCPFAKILEPGQL
eukprot:g11907.t1